MKKIFISIKIIILFFTLNLNVYSKDSNNYSKIMIDCIDENLNPCNSKDKLKNNTTKKIKVKNLVNEKLTKDKKILNKNKNENILTPAKKENKKKISINKKEPKKKKILNNNEKKIYKKIVKKKENKKKKNTSPTTLAKKSKVSFNFDKELSFENFKNLLIKYSSSSKYPDINN